MMSSLRRRYEPRLATLRASDTAKAAGLAAAMICNNIIALGSTFVFARMLGDDYGRLAALISYLLILTVAGQAMQVATAREGVLGHLGTGEELLATIRSWMRVMLVFTVVLTVVSIILRQPIADLVGVKRFPWAAAVGLPAGCLFLAVSLLRGALQGIGDYRSVGYSLVGEQASRLVTGRGPRRDLARDRCVPRLAAVLRGDVAVLRLEPPAYGAWRLPHKGAQGRRQFQVVRPRATRRSAWRPHVKRAWAPIAGLIVIAVLQNIDLISANHQFTKHTASCLLGDRGRGQGADLGRDRRRLLPRARGVAPARRGEDTRPVLAGALGITVVCAVPVLLIFAGVPHLLLSIAFGSKRATASRYLIVLGSAFTVLACTYLAIQYMLALKRTWFLVPLALVAIAEPLVLGRPRTPTGFAAVVLSVQLVGALPTPSGSPCGAISPRRSSRDEREVRAVEPELVGASRV